jgi:hypothetical protein
MKILAGIVLTLISLAAIGQIANTATITFTGVSAYMDGTPIPSTAVKIYDLYQGLKGRTKTRVGSFSSGGQITTGLLSGAEYCWDVVAIVDGVASDHSGEGCKKFNNIPGVVVITVT